MGGEELGGVDPLGENVQLDEGLLAYLPTNCRVLSVSLGGKSLWIKTIKIVVQLEDGSTAEYFKKGAWGPRGAAMMEGAFEAERALHTLLPNVIPKPIAWGNYASNPEFYFYLCEFVNMDDTIPTPEDWAAAVSNMHITTMGKSPTGQFGFPVSTHMANVPVDNTWNPSWEAFWAQQMKSLFDQEEHANGPDETVAELRTAYFEQAIPRYLRPLESDGRSVTPCLIHSDLWPGNIMYKTDGAGLCMFDSCAYWGHHEADLGICYNPRYKLNRPAIDQYKKQYNRRTPFAKMADKDEDEDKRCALYAMKFHVLLSIMHSDKPAFREILVHELKMLLGRVDDPAA